jgi:capsular polysaccharide transport system permease protein
MKLSPPTRPSEPLAASGITPPGRSRLPEASGRRVRKRGPGVRFWYLLLVVVPTLLAGVYFYGFAADIYESEARFVVRNRSSGGSPAMISAGGSGGSGIAGLLSATQSGSEESRAVISFIDSHAAVAALQRTSNLVEIWRRPEADHIARLWWEEPQVEWLHWYFRRRVRAVLDAETGVLQLRVQAFRPDDARLLAEQLLKLSEELVNTFTARSMADAIRAAQEDVTKAEQRVVAARDAMTAFREREQAFDPARSAAGAIETIGRLEASLAQARTELQERRSFMRADNPQIQVLNNRITALQQQIATERGRVTRGQEALTQQVAGMERLELERAFADRQLASATSTLEEARSNALRQQVFLARIADPHLPEWALYPRAAFNILTLFISLSVLFGIAWLLIVSAREHAR